MICLANAFRHGNHDLSGVIESYRSGEFYTSFEFLELLMVVGPYFNCIHYFDRIIPPKRHHLYPLPGRGSTVGSCPSNDQFRDRSDRCALAQPDEGQCNPRISSQHHSKPIQDLEKNKEYKLNACFNKLPSINQICFQAKQQPEKNKLPRPSNPTELYPPTSEFLSRPSLRRLSLLLLTELGDFDLHVLVHPRLQLGPIAKEEQNLHPDKQRCKQQGLDEVIQQRRSTTLKLAVADKLRQPGDNVDATGPVVHIHSVGSEQVVTASCEANHQRGEQAARDRFEEDIEKGVDEGSDGTSIGREVVGGENIRGREESRAVTCL